VDAKRVMAEALADDKLAKKLAKKDTVKTQPPSEKNQNQRIP
jgi:outer membrane protein assembly factor BamD